MKTKAKHASDPHGPTPKAKKAKSKSNSQEGEEGPIGSKLHNILLTTDNPLTSPFDFAIDFEVVNKRSKLEKLIDKIEFNSAKYSSLSHEFFFYLFCLSNLMLQNYNIYKSVCSITSTKCETECSTELLQL